MARKKNENASIKIQITTSYQIGQYLDTLLKTGLYGRNRAECAEALMCEQLRQEMKQMRIRLLNPKDENPEA